MTVILEAMCKGRVTRKSIRKLPLRDVWVAQLVRRPTSAQVMISQFVGSSPVSGSVLMAQSLEPASDSVSPSLFLSLPHSCSVSLCFKIK